MIDIRQSTCFAALLLIGALTPAWAQKLPSESKVTANKVTTNNSPADNLTPGNIKTGNSVAVNLAAIKQSGDRHLNEFEYQLALDEYRHYMTLRSQPDAEVTSRMALCDQWLGRKGLAALEFQRAAKLEGESLNGYLARFDAHLVLWEYDEALACANDACAHFKNEWKCYWRLGYLHNKYCEFTEAIDAYTKAIELFPAVVDPLAVQETPGPISLARLYALRAHCFYRLDNYRQSIADLNKLIALEPKSEIGYESRAEAFMRLNDLAAAEGDFKKAVELKTQRARTYKQLGYCLLRRGSCEEAVSNFTIAIKLAPRYAEAFHLRAESLRKLGKGEVAASDEKAARRLGFHLQGV